MACVEKFLLLVGLGHLDGTVELGVDLLRHLCVSLVEVALPAVFVEVESCEGNAGVLELFADLGHGLHVDIEFNTEFAAEDVDELDGRSCRATAKPPDVGVDDIDALYYGCQHRSKAVAGGAMCVEIHGHLKRGFQLGHEGVYARGIHKACHILEGHHLGAEFLHLDGLVYEVVVGEDLLVLSGALGVDRVAYGRVGDSLVAVESVELVDHLDGALDVVEVVECVEDTHHVQTVFDRFLIESFKHVIGVGYIAEKVAAT